MKLKTVGLCVLLALVVSGCADGRGPGTKQTIGGLGGAAVGGLLGSQFGSGTGQLAFTAAGVVLGGLVGSEIGRSMDDIDREKSQRAALQARTAPIGQPITWNNPNSGNSGTVTPTRDGTSPSGEYCREFQQTITVGGKTEQGYGTACRKSDGSWQIQ